MLSPASLGDILIGKSLFVLIVTVVVLALSIFLVGYTPANLVILSIALLLSTVFYIALGTICGLFAKSIMEGSIIVLPVIFIFSFGPLALTLASTYPFLKIAEWLPSSQLLLLAEALEGKYSMTDMIIPMVTIIAWSLISWFLAAIFYKKRMVD